MISITMGQLQNLHQNQCQINSHSKEHGGNSMYHGGNQSPGPQEDYESEFQVPPPTSPLSPPTWPSSPTAIVKLPNRTTPTTLDRYEIQLLTHHGQQDWIREAAFNQERSAGSDLRPSKERSSLEGEQQNTNGYNRGSNWIPPPGWEESLSSEYQEALKHLRMAEQDTVAKQTEGVRSSSNLQPITSTGPHRNSCDYQMQLMLLEQQNKRRLMRARWKQDSMASDCPIVPPESIQGTRDQSVDSVWSTQFTPESTPGFQEEIGIQLKFEPEPSPVMSDSRRYVLQVITPSSFRIDRLCWSSRT